MLCLKPESDKRLVMKENIRQIFIQISENKDTVDCNQNKMTSPVDILTVTKVDLPPGIHTTHCIKWQSDLRIVHLLTITIKLIVVQ